MPLFVRITSVPPGDAPLWVREQWVGVTLHVVKQVDQGLVVVSRFAIEKLEETSPAAARWWRDNMPDALLPRKAFTFAAGCGEVFEQAPPAAKQAGSMLVTARLNARLRPQDRGFHFEDPLDALMKDAGSGSVTGGGTQQADNGEVIRCDIDLQVPDHSQQTLDFLVDALQKLGAPRGSTLEPGGAVASVPVGVNEGLAIFLNGSDLPPETYRTSDINVVVSEIGKALGNHGRLLSHWEGPRETALYLYGRSFETMQATIRPALAALPLCERCRIIQIA